MHTTHWKIFSNMISLPDCTYYGVYFVRFFRETQGWRGLKGGDSKLGVLSIIANLSRVICHLSDERYCQEFDLATYWFRERAAEA